MSLDFMLLASLSDDRPIGPRAAVLELARRELGIDLEQPEIEVSGMRFEVALAIAAGQVSCINVRPLDDGFAPALTALARALGLVVFDGQTGRELGAEEPAIPERAASYALRLVAPDLGALGSEHEVRRRLTRSLRIDPTSDDASGPGWSLRIELGGRADTVERVALRAAWSTAVARDELVTVVVRCAEENGWVPFDPQRNDTLP